MIISEWFYDEKIELDEYHSNKTLNFLATINLKIPFIVMINGI